MLSSKRRGTTLSAKAQTLAMELDIPLESIYQLTKPAIKKRQREAVQDLRTVQYNASLRRQQWLEQNAQDIARAAGECDWKKKMEEMIHTAKEREINRKLSSAMKGTHQSLSWIEVPTAKWFYSHKKKEIYRYDKGVFECYAAWSPTPSLIPTSPWHFYCHHHLKVPHDDIAQAEVEDNGEYYILNSVHHPRNDLWRVVSGAKEIEALILECNKRHLQQATVEASRGHDPIMSSIMEDHGTDLLD